MNNTTTITLNDRFSMFKSSNGATQSQQRGRARSRSRSRGRPQQQVDLRGSQKNRKLLDQLEQQHKMRLAMKLKNKSILTSRGRAQGQIIRTGARRAANIKKAVNVRNLRRTNSLTTFVPLNDSGPRRNMRGRSRSRSQSRNRAQQQAGSITDRLGVRQPRRRMRRGPPNGTQQQQQTQRSRSRTRSRVRLNRNNFNNQNNNGNNRNANNSQVRANSARRVNSARRSNSVNARLGGNNGQGQIRRRNNVTVASGRRRSFGANTRNANTQLKKPLAGRIVKRNPRKPVGGRMQRQPGNAPGANPRRGKMIKRGINAQPQARGRANNRGVNNGQAGQGSRRGRSRTRRGGAANGNNKRGGGGGAVSKAALDKQLDDYMSKGSA